MTIFQKMFGKKPDNNMTRAYLDGIAAGADPAKVLPLLKGVAGDAISKEHYEALATCGDATPEEKAKAVEVIYSDYLKCAGDADVCPHCGKSPCACEKPAGDDKPKEEPAGDDKPEDKPEEPAKEEPKSAGDALPEIDYNRLAAAVAPLLVGQMQPPVQTAGDSLPGKQDMKTWFGY